VILNEYSKNLNPEHWTLIANKVAEKIRSGKYSGVIVSHGTDTMHYTASALSFALQNLPVPVVLVGARLLYFCHFKQFRRKSITFEA
jgi:glutamyl-tRNA(Gln) amidotransferase subunit D